MPRHGIKNPLDANSPTDRTFHNCPPSFWRHCDGCGHPVRAQDTHQGRHFRFAGRQIVKCGPVRESVTASGGTASLVKRYDG